MVEYKTTRLWTFSDSKRDFEKNKNLINNKLKSVLDDKKISEALQKNSVEKFSNERRVYAIADHCDIRKEYSCEMENIGTVRDLNGQMIPGFNTLGTILIDENKKDITLADLTVFSNGECRFVTQQELRDYAKKSIKDKKREAEIKSFIESKTNINMIVSLKEQARRVSQSLKAKNPDIKVCHGHDRLSDTVEYYEYINLTLKDEFVSRAKISRNSNKKKLNPKTKKNEFIKLVNVVFSNKELYQIDKLRLKPILPRHNEFFFIKPIK